MANALERFLQKNTVGLSIDMPLFHTTRAYHAKKILKEGAIEPQNCQVFLGEKLSYLFYGRPSYKFSDDALIAKYWQLPTVFIFDSDVCNVERVFPFDTGAFENKMYPKFFGMMPRDEYELKGIADYPQKIVSAFFVDAERYFKLKPRKEDDFVSTFSLTVTDEEVRALYDLIGSSDNRLDDRRFAIEVQTRDRLDISLGNCRAIIMPEEYLESEEIIKKCSDFKIEIMSYPSYPLKQEMYYYAIYNAVFELYRDWGIVR
jgi:hypothetical protein